MSTSDSQITRFEVIDHRKSTETPGRILVLYGIAVELSYQDDGHTLKVFLVDPNPPKG